MWDPDQIVALFDSLLKAYPISSFLFRDIRPENRDSWDVYKFVEHFRYGDTHNALADTDGRDVTLVLDGQQRLTSLIVGLRGSYTVKLKNKRWDNPSAWEKRRLYIDLLKDPSTGDEEDREDVGITYGLKFSGTEPVNSDRSLWIKVGTILDYDSPDAFDKYKDALIGQLPDTFTRAQDKDSGAKPRSVVPGDLEG